MVRSFKNFIHALEAETANLIYGIPGAKIATIGVTGTDGKTTTSSLIFHILKTAGYNPAMITTVGAQIGDKTYSTGLHTTTPSAFTVQRYIKYAVEEKCDFLVLEVTSHALDQNRVRNVNFKIGVLTNITHEHLDYHGTYEKYLRIKSKLFKKSEISILNMDDGSYDQIMPLLSKKNIVTYSLSKNSDFNLKNIGLKLPGEFGFNFENFMAAISAAKILGIKEDKIALALSTFKFPQGRQEIVYDKDFQIIIDFAHTPNSFEKILPILKQGTTGKLIHVFGSAGKRDVSKRPVMGSVSAKYANVIILTAEDSRGEDISKINEQIKKGIIGFTGELIEEPDRQKAINMAVGMALPKDRIVITGKGHEQSMNLGNGEITWSEHESVKNALSQNNLL